MVRLGVISDSHHSEYWVQSFLRRATKEQYDAVYFLGDGESEAKWLKRRLKMPLYFVCGNCDVFSKAERALIGEHEGHRLVAVHGHYLDVKWGLETLSYYAEEQGADIALYGHTHIPRAEFVGPVFTLNPGALMNGNFAELTIDGKRVVPRLLYLGDR